MSCLGRGLVLLRHAASIGTAFWLVNDSRCVLWCRRREGMTESAGTSWQKREETIVRLTERYLSWRKKRKLARKAKQKARNPIVDWLDAIGSAIVIVLLINQ